MSKDARWDAVVGSASSLRTQGVKARVARLRINAQLSARLGRGNFSRPNVRVDSYRTVWTESSKIEIVYRSTRLARRVCGNPCGGGGGKPIAPRHSAGRAIDRPIAERQSRASFCWSVFMCTKREKKAFLRQDFASRFSQPLVLANAKLGVEQLGTAAV